MNTQDKELSVCIFCDKPVYRGKDEFNLALDRPVRIDLKVHRTCYKRYRDEGNLKEFLQESLMDYIEKYAEDTNGKAKKKARRS